MSSFNSLSLSLLLASGAVSAADFPLTVDSEHGKLKVERVAEGLQIPWAIDFLPDGKALVTERPGTLSIVDLGSGERVKVHDVPAVAARNQGGLLDVLVHPKYAENRKIYLCFSVEVDGGYTTRVARYTLSGGHLKDAETLFDAAPAFNRVHHFGCRMQIDAQGYLYFTVGDRLERDLAQSLESHNGKVLRIHDDGRIPKDNPFVDTPRAKPEIWSYGHRNPQGLAFRPGTSELWSHEHGPRGGDEINLVSKGLNYGWPVITFGREYHGPSIGEGTEKEGMQQPVLQWTPSIGPSGMEFYSADLFPAWKGHLFSGGMALTYLSRVELDGQRFKHEEKLFSGLGWRIREVDQGPDGALYLLTDNSWLLRVTPAEG